MPITFHIKGPNLVQSIIFSIFILYFILFYFIWWSIYFQMFECTLLKIIMVKFYFYFFFGKKVFINLSFLQGI